MKKILFAITAAAIMIVAATMVPAVNCNESDVDEYIVNTVEVKDNFQSYLDSINEKATKNMTYDKEDCSYSLNTSAYEIYGDQEFDDAQLSVTMNENGLVSNYGNIDFNDDADVSEKGTIVSDSDTECDADYTLVYDDNGYVSDIMIIIDGQECSARELYDPMDDCFVWVLIPVVYEIVKWCLFFTIIILVWNFISMHFASTDEGIIYLDYTTKIVDGIEFGYDSNNPIPVCLSIYGVDYAFSSKYINDTSGKDNNNYYFAYLDDYRVYIFPHVITKTTACSVIDLNNADFNVFTYYGVNASAIVGPYPVYHSAHHEGEYNHYHKGFYIGGKMDNESSHSLFMY